MSTAPRAAPRPATVVGLVLLTGAAIALRGWLTCRGDVPPGDGAAYALLQVRRLLADGHLALGDLPLTFWLQASLAWLLERTGTVRERAIWLAVFGADAVLPALAAVPACFLGLRRLRLAGRPAAAALLPAALAVLSFGPLLDVATAPARNLGCALALAFVAALEAQTERPARANAVFAAGLLLLTALTHLGAFAVALAMLLSARHRPVALLVVGAVGLGLAVALRGDGRLPGLLNGELAVRLLHLAHVPATVLLAAWLSTGPPRVTRQVGAAVAALCTLAVLTALDRPVGPLVGARHLEDLRVMRAALDVPARTLVVARPSLVWWAGWELGTPVATPAAVGADTWTRYHSVMYLVEPGARGDPSPPPEAELRYQGFALRLFEVVLPPAAVPSAQRPWTVKPFR